ncbi:hypothetical protein [Flammeovirga sp. EKP202]|uniref:hypothetical protein n=1 Tax=Flammeovirga sp. EKP202 TaxID=2770592 RepID=UPI00165FEA3F|nr:hypothetical protein [Flammeovirga sp. EKP202]MBD0403880.1 hypothetical protein [Flammeovirga sp. EKP202]
MEDEVLIRPGKGILKHYTTKKIKGSKKVALEMTIGEEKLYAVKERNFIKVLKSIHSFGNVVAYIAEKKPSGKEYILDMIGYPDRDATSEDEMQLLNSIL